MKSVAIAVACTLLACGASTRPRLKYGYYSGPTISGTVTSVTAGSGLTGGTITRSGTIAVDTSTTQSRVSGVCTGSNAIQTIAADGSVTCVAGGGGGGGTVTSITAGTGLTGGTITSTGTIAADTTFLQERVSGTCGAGNAIQVINGDGTVTCQAVGTGTVTGPGTVGDLPIWTGLTALGNYGGSTATSCGATSAVTGAALSAAGVLTTTCTAQKQGTVTSVATGTGLTGGPITTTGTVSLANTAVTAGSYTHSAITVDAQGRITAASSDTTTVTTPSGGLNGDLALWTGTHTIGEYGGSSCGAGTTATSIAATGVLTCGITPITGTIDSGYVPYSTGSNTLAASDIFYNGSTASIVEYANASGGLTLGYQSISGGYNVAGTATLHLNTVGYHASTTYGRDVEIDDGQGTGAGHEILYGTGSTKGTELFGALQVDSSAQVRGAFSVYNNGTIPTISGCGTGATIASESTNNGGTITLGTTAGVCQVTFSTAPGYGWTHAPACTAIGNASREAGTLYSFTSATTLSISGLTNAASGDLLYYTCIGEKN